MAAFFGWEEAACDNTRKISGDHSRTCLHYITARFCSLWTWSLVVPYKKHPSWRLDCWQNHPGDRHRQQCVASPGIEHVSIPGRVLCTDTKCCYRHRYGPVVRQRLRVYGGGENVTVSAGCPGCLLHCSLVDVHGIWCNGQVSLQAFLQHANLLHEDTKLTLTCRQSVSFRDVKV